MNLTDRYVYRWWHPLAIALFWIFLLSFGCTPVPPQPPEPPKLATIVVDYVPGVGRIIIPSVYNAGVNLCVQDPMRQNTYSCARLYDLRRVLPEQQYAEDDGLTNQRDGHPAIR